MQRFLVALSLTLLTACGASPDVPPVQVRAHPDTADRDEHPYAAGKRHLAAGRLGLAVEKFRTAVARDRSDVAALNALASCYDRLGRFDLADRYYDQALALSLADAQTLNNIGVSNLMRGHPVRAAAMLEMARKAAPDDPQVTANLERANQAADKAQAVDAASDEEPERPNRLERSGLNAWSLRTGEWLQPAAWLKPSPSRGEEPPLPAAAPRPVVTRVALDDTVTKVALDEVIAPLPPQAAPAQVQPGASSLHIVNGVGRRGMAARMRALLASHGFGGMSVADAPRFDVRDTVLSYRPGREPDAARVANLLPPGIRLEARHDQRHDLTLVLGRDLIPFDLSK